MKLSRIVAVIALVAGIGAAVAAQRESAPATPPTAARTGPAVNADAALLAEFKTRVDAYMDVRGQALKGAPPLKETDDPEKIVAARDAMAARIRSVRADARHGDVFTPPIAAHFRRLLSPELKGEDGRDAKQILKDDAPPPAKVPFKVNAKYPEGVALPRTPANLLLSLPQVPDPLQYRFIDRHLILLDTEADVIVDYALNMIK